MSLVEVLAGAVIGAVVAGGTMTAFVTALRIAEPPRVNVEAIQMLQQTMERQRNRIACDDGWFNTATCRADFAPSRAFTPDPTSPLLRGPNNRFSGPMPVAEMKAKQLDCSGDGVPDCMQVTVRVKAGEAP